MERCRECGRLADGWLDNEDERDDTCRLCGGELEELRITIRRPPAPPPTSGEELSDRLLGIGA